jgi:CMP-N,N'-diacetyllegionaminic acid synthase
MTKNTFTFLGVIPARAGSKGIKNKNIKLLNGLPLVAYSIAAAKKSKLLKHVVVSTESEKIAAVAKKYGGNVPFMRPAEFSTDQAPTPPVLKHAVEEYEHQTGLYFTHIVLLQPTTPLRLARDIDGAIKLMISRPDKNNVVSCYKSETIHPKKMYSVKDKEAIPYEKGDKVFRRQDVSTMYIRNGSVYIIRRDLVMEGGMFDEAPLLYQMPRLRSIDIDGMVDWKLCELILKSKAHLKDDL